MEYLISYINEVRPLFEPSGNHLWINDWKDRVTYQNYQSKVKNYWRSIGLHHFSTHSLRHSAGTHMLKNGAPLYGISFFLGHRNISSTEIYTKIEPLEVKRAIDDLELRE